MSQLIDKLNIFSLPSSLELSKIVLIPVPWDVTTSYGGGAALGPRAIFNASTQVDLYDYEVKESYKEGYFMLEIDKKILHKNNLLRKKALPVMKAINSGKSLNTSQKKSIIEINKACDEIHDWVYQTTLSYLKQGKIVGIIGGDHSTPLGAIKAIGEIHDGNFGILHIDAHLDLRSAYHGFKHSHASIMHNVFHLKNRPQKLTQFGIRDFCREEYDMVKSNPEYFDTHFDIETQNSKLSGVSWLEICDTAIRKLPDNIYVSFDIDGLNPALCPGTGTPVPGGLEFPEMLALLAAIHRNKKRIIGFDLVEVSKGPHRSEWNENVGARVLFKLCGWSVMTNS